jgi:hypothetical protein
MYQIGSVAHEYLIKHNLRRLHSYQHFKPTYSDERTQDTTGFSHVELQLHPTLSELVDFAVWIDKRSRGEIEVGVAKASGVCLSRSVVLYLSLM